MRTGRNDPCPCGSGKKYKRCCLSTQPPPAGPASDAAAADTPSGQGSSLWTRSPEEFSPGDWDLLASLLPRRKRRELAPQFEQVKLVAEYRSREAEIDAAFEAIEAHHAAYKKLREDSGEFIRVAEALFRDERFACMRYSAADIQRALDGVGYRAVLPTDKRFLETTRKAIAILADREQQTVLANRLLLMLPDFVKAGRLLEAAIIQESAWLMLEPQDATPPFLLAMYLHGLTEWTREREAEELRLFAKAGLDIEQAKEKGAEWALAQLRKTLSRPGAEASFERFLDKHPELQALVQARCEETEAAAIAMLQRDDARALLLSAEETMPWTRTLSERLAAEPTVARLLARGKRPGKAATEVFLRAFREVGSEMAQAIFTPARLARLADQIEEYKRQVPEAEQEAVADGICGALAAARCLTDRPQDSHFLSTLCCFSMHRVTQEWVTAAKAGDGGD